MKGFHKHCTSQSVIGKYREWVCSVASRLWLSYLAMHFVGKIILTIRYNLQRWTGITGNIQSNKWAYGSLMWHKVMHFIVKII